MDDKAVVFVRIVRDGSDHRNFSFSKGVGHEDLPDNFS
jgi:hypothetical protein